MIPNVNANDHTIATTFASNCSPSRLAPPP